MHGHLEPRGSSFLSSVGSEKKNQSTSEQGEDTHFFSETVGKMGIFMKLHETSQTFVGFPNSEGRNFTIVERLRLVEMLFLGLQKPLECWDP